MKWHFFLFAALILAIPRISSAQQLFIGNVRDKVIKIPLPQARITLLTADSVVVQDSIPVNLQKGKKGRLGTANFFIKLPKKTCTYILRARLNGYTDDYRTFTSDSTADHIEGLDPLELRRVFETKLGEATVTATKLKMYYKGDTLVYDASAFQMPDGSMLDDLLHQMPGVTMNDAGEIFVNGRKVDELLLGSRSFFGGNSKVLLENLPYYTVKNIKVYDKENELYVGTKKGEENKRHVMDINLKDEYRNGYIGNVEAAGGTRERRLGRAFLLGFTDRLRFTLLANANNVNEKRHIGETGQWKPENMPLSILTTKSVAAEMDYESEKGLVKENFMVNFTTSKNRGETRQRSELFLDGTTPYSTFVSSNTTRQSLLEAKNSLILNMQSKVYITNDLAFEYKKYKGNSETLTEDFLDRLNTRVKSSAFNEGHKYSVTAGGHISPRNDKSPWRPFFVFYGFSHTDERNEAARGFVTEQFITPDTQEQYNANDFHHRKTNGSFHLIYSKSLGKGAFFEIQDNQIVERSYKHDVLYHPEELTLPSQLDAIKAVTDPKNSYESDLVWWHNRPNVSLSWGKQTQGELWKFNYLHLQLFLRNCIKWERLNYERNLTTQRKKRLSYSLNPRFSFKYAPTKKEGEFLELIAAHYYSPASILDMLDYRDDATPQVVKLGNPYLKGDATTKVELKFSDHVSKRKGQNYNLTGVFHYYHRQVAQSVMFNPANSQYTYQPKNVKGAYKAEAHFNFTRFIDKRQRWSWKTSLDAEYNHAIDHVIQDGAAESAPNAVNTTTLHDGIWLQYLHKDFSVRATGDFRWRHSEGRMRDFSTLDAFDYQYGASARYTLPVIKTTLSVDGNMYSRRGYGSTSLNTDDFVLNASLSQPFLKGKIIASIEAFDILHQLSSTQYTVNAQGRTETWNRTLPNYVMLHVAYHFNKNPKRK